MHFSNHRRDLQPDGRSREMTLARFTKIKLQVQIFIAVAQFLEEKLKVADKAVSFSFLVKKDEHVRTYTKNYSITIEQSDSFNRETFFHRFSRPNQ